MLASENKTYPLKKMIIGAFGYQSITARRKFIKISNKLYRVYGTNIVVSYRSITSLKEAISLLNQ